MPRGRSSKYYLRRHSRDSRPIAADPCSRGATMVRQRISNMARFEFTQRKSSKFWEVLHRGTKITVRWGRIGTTGQSKVRTFANAVKAAEFQAKLVREKIG